MAHSEKKKTDEAEYNSNLSPKQYSILVFLALVYLLALRFPQSRFLPVYTHGAPLTFF